MRTTLRLLEISIHALREEGDQERLLHSTRKYISIHALREEGDQRPLRAQTAQGISIHALREEGDAEGDQKMSTGLLFLSTPSARRATLLTIMADTYNAGFLSTPSARRATF